MPRLSSIISTFAVVSKKHMKELVSVIMPTYNASRYVADSIESVLNQTYEHLELLIADDNSTDEETLRLLAYYEEKDERVKVFRLKENSGPGVARNTGISAAKGRYIAFCDSDDRWMPDKLERQLAYMQQEGCALCCSSYIICNSDGKECGICIAPETITYKMMLKDNKVGCLTAIYDTQLLGEKYYMPTLRKRQDWGLFLKIIKKCKQAKAITAPLAYYRIRKGSVSQSKIYLIKYNARVYQEVLGFSTIKSYIYFFFLFLPCYGMKVMKKKIDSYRYLREKRNL